MYFGRGEEGGGPSKLGARNTIWRVKLNEFGSFLPETAQEVFNAGCGIAEASDAPPIYETADYGCGQPSVATLNDERRIIAFRKPGPLVGAKHSDATAFHWLNSDGTVGAAIGQVPTAEVGAVEDGASPELFAIRGDSRCWRPDCVSRGGLVSAVLFGDESVCR